MIPSCGGASMNAFADCNNPGLAAGSRIKGYRVTRAAELREINSFYYELEHKATGAKHVHISNADTENTFSVAFKTVPADSTGVAHILEHTALCGSAKYPVRDPFFSMLKRSLSTFMNAFTASDWTMYPFSTQNRKDFYNLMDVYLDAAFFPKLDRLSFSQEGHRLEIEGGKLVYKGVVYNEMKGAMSSPDQVLVRSLMKELYPDTTYGNNSGGDPSDIPALTYQQLIAFHKRHYHPSNAFFYTYGNLPLEAHLSLIQEKILNHFEKIDPKTEVPSQPRWSSPKKASCPYPLDPSEDPSKKYQACTAWLAADIKDPFEVLVLSLLEHILLGNSASPLRKALIDSGLGTSLSDGTGYDEENRDTFFACGLKDVEAAAAEKIEGIIFDVLKSLADKGIDRELIESAIHQEEFHRKEITNHPYPYGIKLLLAFCGSWFHGGDPLRVLRFDDDLKRLREELADGPFFESRIRSYFLENPHRVLFTLVPDQTLEKKENERVEKELADIKAGISPHEYERIRQDMEALEKLQETPEDVSVLPTLEREDIPPSIQSVPETAWNFDAENSMLEIGNRKSEIKTGSFPSPIANLQFPIAVYEQPCSGIFYFDAVAGVGNLSENLMPLAPFFCHAFSRMGTARRDYAEMARLIDAYTGGIGLSVSARTGFGKNGDCLPFVTFSGKCLVRNLGKMFDIISELLYEFAFSDLPRLKNLLLEYRAALESGIVHNGHGLAISLASRNFSTTRMLGESWHGIHQLHTLKQITEDLGDEKLKAFAEDLKALGKAVFTPENFKIALVGEASPLVEAMTRALPLFQSGLGGADAFVSPSIAPDREVPREGWSTSSAVSFVARTFETVRMGHPDAAALSVTAKLLRSLYLHREIREKGGAYGGLASYNPEDGLFAFASYRDPHIFSTLRVYDGAVDFIKSGRYTEDDIKEAILQVCSEIDRPNPPGPAARNAFYRKIVSLSDAARQHFKEQLLSLTRDQVVQVTEKYFFNGDKQKQGVAVISSEEKLKAANEKMPECPLRLYRI